MTLTDYIKKGYQVKSSHCDSFGSHYVILQSNTSVVMACIAASAWTGKPKTDEDDIAIWEIN